mgnify:CR=1 FL=1
MLISNGGAGGVPMVDVRGGQLLMDWVILQKALEDRGIRDLPGLLQPGDLLAVLGAGAYGAVMGSSYNARPRPPEVLVEGNHWRVVRRRETIEELYAWEFSGPFLDDFSGHRRPNDGGCAGALDETAGVENAAR